MINRLFKAELAGFAFCCVLGTFLHFVYNWSGKLVLAGALCPVNESVWEHLKLIYTPYFIWSIAEFFILKSDKNNLFTAKLFGSLSGMLTILFIYYTYTGAFGNESMVIDIISFFAGVAAAFLVSYTIIKNTKFRGNAVQAVSFVLLAALGVLFVIFTFSPPLIPLFEDPVTKTYGI